MAKPTEMQIKAAANVAAGMGRTEALKAAGYSDSSAESMGNALTKAPGFRVALFDQVKQIADRPMVTPVDQERFVRHQLFDGALANEGMTKARYLELLGKDKRVGMFQPDVIVGVQVNMADMPDHDDPRLLEPLPEVDD